MVLSKTHKYVCIEVLMSDKGNQYRAITFRQKGEQMDYEFAAKADSLDALPKKIFQRQVPVYVLFNGKGIISRKVEWGISLQNESILEAVFPNARTEDFLISKQDAQGATWASLARMETIREHCETIRKKKVFITGIGCGPQFVSSIIRYIKETEFSTGHAKIINAGNEGLSICSENSIEDRIRINDEESEAGYAPLLGFGFSVEDAELGMPEEIKNENKEFKYYLKSFNLLKNFLIIIFGLLLINFYFFQTYNEKMVRYESEVNRNTGLLAEYDTLKNEFDRKVSYLNEAGLMGKHSLAYYADQLAISVPADIALKKLDIFPVAGGKDEGEGVRIKKDTIQINGIAGSPISVNDWLNDISKLKWVKNARIMNYNKNKGEEAGFELILSVKPVE